MLASINQTEVSLTSLGAVLHNTSCNDDYLFSKFRKLQEAALSARTKLNAIPGNATVDDKGAEVISALWPVDRCALTVSTIQPHTPNGAVMKACAVAWLASGNFDRLLEIAEIAA